jgi:PAS domain S-box-containing protein
MATHVVNRSIDSCALAEMASDNFSPPFVDARGHAAVLDEASGQREASDHLRRLLDATRILPWEADVSTSLFTNVGDQAVNIFGYPLEDWYRPNFWSAHLHPADRGRAMARFAEYLNTKDEFELDYRMIAKDGHVVWLHDLVSVCRENGRPKNIRGFSIDVTESREREAALRDLSGRLIDAQEEERRRVARELHDDLNQRLALLSIELERLEQKFHDQAELCRRLERLQMQTNEISSDVHRLSYKLHPSKLDHLGLAAAVKSLCAEVAGMSNIEVELFQEGFSAHLPKDITLCVFRIAQEALRNCVKHSGASLAEVVLNNTNDAVYLTVSDNGRGFDMQSETMRKGLGFTSMRERLRLVNGLMEVKSRPGHGAQIKVFVPLSQS